jgi:hypothetical protein
MAQREAVHVVRAVRFEHVRFEQRVVLDAVQRDAVVREHLRVVLQVLADLLAVGRFEPRLQAREHVVERQLLGQIGPAMRDRQIRGLPGSTENDMPTSRAVIGSSDVVSVSNAVSAAASIFASHASNCAQVWIVSYSRTMSVGPPAPARRRARRRRRLRRCAVDLAQPCLEAVAREDVAQQVACFAVGLQRRLDRFEMRCEIAGRLDGDELAAERQEVERARRLSPTTPLISSACSITPSRLSYW